MPTINVLFFSQVRSGWSRKLVGKTSRPLHIFSSHSLFIQCLSSMVVITSLPFLLLLLDRKFPEKLKCFRGREHLNFESCISTACALSLVGTPNEVVLKGGTGHFTSSFVTKPYAVNKD